MGERLERMRSFAEGTTQLVEKLMHIKEKELLWACGISRVRSLSGNVVLVQPENAKEESKRLADWLTG